MLPFSQAAENNKEPIANILRDAFKNARSVLEIGSGTGQHAVHLGEALAHLTWQTSELPGNLDGVATRLAAEGPENVPTNVIAPVALDVSVHPWPIAHVDGIFSANCVHIMSWDHVAHLFRGVGEVLGSGGTLCLYGPYKYGGEFTTPSNADFDDWLKARDRLSGVRDFEAVDALAQAQGLSLLADHPMPANNQLLVWRR